jgi:phosphate transport system substrate-binding protein
LRPAFVACLSLSIALVACNGGTSQPTPDPLSGQYNASGGTAATPVVQELTKRFSERHPGVVWQLEDVGSSSSIKLTALGDVDFGFISRELEPSEVGKVELLSIGAIGTAVAVNSANPVKSLTKDQVRKIFSGEITNWAQVGGNPGHIRVLVREANSPTRSAFEAFFWGDQKPAYAKDAIDVFESSETIKAIGSFRDSIGMVTMSNLEWNDRSLKFLGIDGVAATRENLQSGAYKLRRPLYIVYHPDPTRLKPAVKAFLDFVRGADGQQIVAGF